MTSKIYEEYDGKWTVLSGPLACHKFSYRTESEVLIAVEAYEAGVADGRKSLREDIGNLLTDPNGYRVSRIIS